MHLQSNNSGVLIMSDLIASHLLYRVQFRRRNGHDHVISLSGHHVIMSSGDQVSHPEVQMVELRHSEFIILSALISHLNDKWRLCCNKSLSGLSSLQPYAWRLILQSESFCTGEAFVSLSRFVLSPDSL